MNVLLQNAMPHRRLDQAFVGQPHSQRFHSGAIAPLLSSAHSTQPSSSSAGPSARFNPALSLILLCLLCDTAHGTVPEGTRHRMPIMPFNCASIILIDRLFAIHAIQMCSRGSPNNSMYG
jgi:hypothetical protein